MDQRELQVLKEKKDQRGQEGQQVNKGCRGTKVPRDYRDQLENKALQDREALPVSQERMDPRDLKVNRD